MIPIRDINPTRTTPVLIYAIVALNALVFLLTLPDLQQAAWDWGAIAAHFTGLEPQPIVDAYGRELRPVPRGELWPVRAVTHFWIHGGWLHVIGNLWFLWVFGDNVEDTLGKPRFVLVYLVSAFAALAAQVISAPRAGIPMVGASGAIGGVLGAYLRLFPHARVVALVPLGFIFFTVVWPAGVFLLVWFGFQLLNAAAVAGPGVAWWAHVGGFAAGFLLAGRKPPQPRRIEVTARRR